MLSVLLYTCNAVLPMILLILLGYLMKQKGFFTKEFLKGGNWTVFHICLPVMLFNNIANIESIAEIRMDVVAYMYVCVFVMIGVGYLLARCTPDPRQKGVLHQVAFRSNFALLGVPLAELLGGTSGVTMAAIISLFSIPLYNIMAVVVLSVYKGGKAKPDTKKILLDICRNPLIIGVLLGMLVLLLRTGGAKLGLTNPLKSLTFVNTALGFLARAATPLSLLVLGGQFEFQAVGTYKKQLLLGVGTRNILAPVIGLTPAAVLTFSGALNFGPEVFAALVALFGTPVAVASAIMAEAMDNDGQLAAQLVVWSSLICMPSMFVFIFLLRALGLL